MSQWGQDREGMLFDVFLHGDLVIHDIIAVVPIVTVPRPTWQLSQSVVD